MTTIHQKRRRAKGPRYGTILSSFKGGGHQEGEDTFTTATAPLFQVDPVHFWNDQISFTSRRYRPLPSSTVLASQSSLAREDAHARHTVASSNPKKNRKTTSASEGVPLLSLFESRVKRFEESRRQEQVGAGSNHNGETNPALVSLPKTAENCDKPLTAQGLERIEEIDDASRATLTQGQHRRFLTLLSELHQKKGLDLRAKKEFRKLYADVLRERKAYVAALLRFRDNHSDRFLMGFQGQGVASSFVKVKSKHTQRLAETWKKECHFPKRYGQCCQTISLQSTSTSTPNESGIPVVGRQEEDERVLVDREMNILFHRLSNPPLTFDTAKFSPQDVTVRLTSSLWEQVCGKDNRHIQFRRVGPRLSGLLESAPASVVLKEPQVNDNNAPGHMNPLWDDEEAKNLAVQHGASVIMTCLAWEALLRRPGSTSTRWTIPLCKQDTDEKSTLPSAKALLFMEDPIPFPCTTRECLTEGIRTSLVEAIYRESCGEEEHETMATTTATLLQSGGSVNVGLHSYTLLLLPKDLSSPTKSQTLKVLVRTRHELVETTTTASAVTTWNPLMVHAKVEYFPIRGYEEFSDYEKVLWISHTLLHPSGCRTLVGRVDPVTARVLTLEEKSLAHALTGEGEEKSLLFPFFDPTTHFQALATVVHACHKLEGGKYSVSLPGRGLDGHSASSFASTTVSVHKSTDDEYQDADDDLKSDVFDLQVEAENASAVFTGKDALQSCFRIWEWNKMVNTPAEQQVPFSFPVLEDVTAKSSKTR